MANTKIKRALKGESLAWLTDAKREEIFKEHEKVDVLEIESVRHKHLLYEVIVCPPTEVAWAESSRRLSNNKEGANDIYGSQSVIADMCILVAEPGLQEELDNEATATPVKVAIGSLIGRLYPMPEAKLKKSLTRPV